MMESIIENVWTALPVLSVIIGGLVLLTNIIVETIKPSLRTKIPTQLTALIVALVLTLAVFLVCCAWIGFTVKWYHVVAALVAGFVVAYGAMYGFDKLKEILDKWKTLKK